jgi:hypothetical protein
MANYAVAVDSPSRVQWESNSGTHWASQSNNCGPTCMTKIAQFFKNTWFGIEATRRLAAPCCRATYYAEQRDMLARRGVAATVVTINSIAHMRNLNASGTRPFGIGVYMARVPAVYRDHPFLQWHELVVLDADVSRNGQRGMLIMDPNFSPPGGYRPDPDRGKKFYPDWVIQYAFINNWPRIGVVPNAPKRTYASHPDWYGRVRPTSHRTRPDTRQNIRDEPDFRDSSIWAVCRGDGYTYKVLEGRVTNRKLWANTTNYLWDGKYDGDFAKVKTRGGKRLYIYRGIVEVTRKP